MALSGGGRGCRDDIFVHSSCDMSCDVNWPMDAGDAHLSASGVTTILSYTLIYMRIYYINICSYTASFHTPHCHVQRSLWVESSQNQ